MLLALDVRNDGIIAGFHSGEGWTTILRLGADRSADELGIMLEACARRAGLERGTAFREAWISSVVPALTPRVSEAVESIFGLTASVVGPGTRTGLKIRTDTPSELGSDIVCAAVAARAVAARDVAERSASIIVDFGSALVLTAVNSSDELLGVSIAPGLDTAARSLRSSTAQIHQVRLETPGRAIGRNTAQSIQSGILLGYRGLIRALVESMTEEMGEPATVTGTGDESGKAVMEGAGYPNFVRHLALDGLAVIADKNRR